MCILGNFMDDQLSHLESEDYFRQKQINQLEELHYIEELNYNEWAQEQYDNQQIMELQDNK